MEIKKIQIKTILQNNENEKKIKIKINKNISSTKKIQIGLQNILNRFLENREYKD